MNKLILYGVITIVISFLFLISTIQNQSQHGVAQTHDCNFTQYKNTTTGIIIQYPSCWEKFESGVNPVVLSKDVVVFRSTSPNSSNTEVPAVFVLSTGKVNLDLSGYTTATIKNIQTNTTGYKRLYSASILLSGNPAHREDGTFRLGNDEINAIDIWTIKNAILFRITFFAESRNYDNYLSTIQKMIDSFKITK